jgi:hypothetical protein
MWLHLTITDYKKDAVFSEYFYFITLNGQRKLEAYLNLSPTVNISWIRSSMQMMLHFAGINIHLVRNTDLPQLHTSSQLDSDHTPMFQKKIVIHIFMHKKPNKKHVQPNITP